jgi:phage-related protein
MPSQARLLREDSLIQPKVQFGNGYAQVIYNGLIRVWDVVFDDSAGTENLRDVISWLDARNPFLWVQPAPYDIEGVWPTRWSLKMHSETNGMPTIASYDFCLELKGPTFVDLARQKYGARDTGFPPKGS